MFNALVLRQEQDKTLAKVEQIAETELPDGEVLVQVAYSTLNYKDGLAITGKGKIIRHFPMVPGIDFTGKVISSNDLRYQEGQQVVLTGWGVGETHWGGLAEKAQVKADWLVPLTEDLTPEQSMQLGTAGLTASLCVQALQQTSITPEQGEILVTGASGGVGSVAVKLLSTLGYQVVAVTGRAENTQWLTELGATRVISREEMLTPNRPLDKQLWAGAIDTVGSHVLAKVLSQVNYNGAVAACGLAGGFDLPTTVMPFILRGVKLLGVDSVSCPFEKRQQAWHLLATTLPKSYFSAACNTISLAQVPEYAEQLIAGQVTGRLLVDLTRKN
ncbi:MDR family oxidoreductase [Motilimonas sp. E26]|uniref:acrylyl-CoA reductase (NADPH) n=1 Tax=Motilimonas sp. E26 TaxID=2865674 RepID=UPI001E38D65A|nr:MDR family oxidoreductase [Motilimonas sp. E26]MCE0558897.1 oxidoreductase [Motilimonas sp. E26]